MTNLAARETFLMPHVNLCFNFLSFKDSTLASGASLTPRALDAAGLSSIHRRGVVVEFFVAIFAIDLLIMNKDLKLAKNLIINKLKFPSQLPYLLEAACK